MRWAWLELNLSRDIFPAAGCVLLICFLSTTNTPQLAAGIFYSCPSIGRNNSESCLSQNPGKVDARLIPTRRGGGLPPCFTRSPNANLLVRTCRFSCIASNPPPLCTVCALMTEPQTVGPLSG